MEEVHEVLRDLQDAPKRIADRAETDEPTSLINTLSCKFDSVRSVAEKLGMRESLNNWDIYWTNTSITVERCKKLKRYQRINHFPGMSEICRKDQLARNLSRLQKLHPDEFTFFPKTWCLHSGISEVLEHAKTHKNDVYIVKPNIGCQGKGICLTNNVNKLRKCDDVICQVYLQKPLLIDGYKFDLRVYALITSCDPLRVFVYNEGLARFATVKYRRPDSFNAANQFMHLTNYSVNKHSRSYVVGEDGTKRRLSSINQWFVSNNHNLKKVWSDIDDAIIKTVMAALPTVRHEYHVAFPQRSSNACFEILGFDLIFDYQSKPYILEVNHSPSFHTNSSIDREIKEALLLDAFNILNLQTTNRVDIKTEERKRARERLFRATRPGDVHSRERKRMITNQNVEWENSHIGNFRKIYPGKRTAHYEQFSCFRSTLFSGTCSSRAKQSSSYKQDSARFKSSEMKTPNSKVPRNSCVVKPGWLVRHGDLIVKERFFIKSNPNHFHTIDDSEERDRLTAMRKRNSLVKSYGMFQTIFENFNNVGLIRSPDESKMQEICSRDLKNSCEEPLKDARETETSSNVNMTTSNFSDTLSNFKLQFQPSFIDECEESERILSKERRRSLLENIGIRKLVVNYFKLSGLLKIEQRVKSKTLNPCRSSNGIETFHRDEKPLKTEKLRKACSSRSVLLGRRCWHRRMDCDRSEKIPRQTDELKEGFIELWKEGYDRADNFNSLELEDSPEIWGTPPEERTEKTIIQPLVCLNSDFP